MGLLTWLKSNWQLIAAVAYALLNLLQAITPHYSGLEGAKKWLFWIVERLAMLTSSDAKTPPPFMRLKLPLQNIPPNSERKTKPPITLLLLVLFFVGCATTGTATDKACAQADKIRMSAQLATAIIDPLMHQRCLAAADECGAQKDATCQALKDCQSSREALDDMIKQALLATDLLCTKK